MRRAHLFLLLTWSCASMPAGESTELKSIIRSDMKESADPCEDFFEYANGTWRAENPIPASMPRWSRRWQTGEQNKEQLKVILDEVSAKKDWKTASVEQQVSDFYGACMDEPRVNEAGVKPLAPLFAKIDAMAGPADLQAAILELNHLGVNVPFLLYATPDNHEPAQTIAWIYASGLGLPDRDYYFKTEDRFKETRAKYEEYVQEIFRLAGEDAATAKASYDAVFAMESKLAEATLDNVARRDPKLSDNKMTFAELQKLAPHLDWKAYFAQAKIAEADLNVEQPKFLTAFDEQLTAAPLPAWKTYLRWQLLNFAAPSLSGPFVVANFNFYQKHLGGATEMKPRWKRCVEQIDQLLGEALGQKYVEKYFPPEAKARMQELVKNELLAMKDIVEGLEWMGPETKKKALEKIATFNPKVGYPDKWIDYSSITISRTDHWANVVGGLHFFTDDNHAQIGKPTDRTRWGMTPPTSNAYYNPQLNEIVFPAGILQSPAFGVNNVDAVNYGAIGVVIGHEISHGFDDQGAQFDAQGRLENWWTSEDLQRFQERTACVADQYENYFIEPNIHHNGKLVLGEAIGDHAGAKIAYLAYKKAQEKNPAATIDGFTPDQQFFIAWGQFRGDETRPETQRTMIQGDPHPVAKFRVIGPLSNMPVFAGAFSCKEGATLVRPAAKRCEVW